MNIFELTHKVMRNITFIKSNYLQYFQTRYAARKGTREKMRKKKVKVEVKKISFIPRNLREKSSAKLASESSKRLTDDYKMLPIDNVWIARFYKWKVYDFENAVECHRETHHPEQYNLPDSLLHAFVELDMRGVKKGKYIDSFSGMAKMPHPFPLKEDRSILVFCKTQELRLDCENAGATIVGDVDLVKRIERGETVLPDINFVLAHPNILPEIVCLKGVLKKKFPNVKIGTVSNNIGELVHHFKTGVQYTVLRDESELDYGWIDVPIGKLNMETEHLKANFISLLNDILSAKPRRSGPFITRVLLKCAPSPERLKVNLEAFIQEEDVASDSDEEELIAGKEKK